MIQETIRSRQQIIDLLRPRHCSSRRPRRRSAPRVDHHRSAAEILSKARGQPGLVVTGMEKIVVVSLLRPSCCSFSSSTGRPSQASWLDSEKALGSRRDVVNDLRDLPRTSRSLNCPGPPCKCNFLENIIAFSDSLEIIVACTMS
jgi:hypothetical protein